MFSPRCDGCHNAFSVQDREREPVSVGCFHTLCRACAESEGGCGLCGRGDGKAVEVREAVVWALARLADGDEQPGDNPEGGEAATPPHNSNKRFKADDAHTALCAAHRQPLLSVFCKDHACFVCAECAATHHKGHALVEGGGELAGEVKAWLGRGVGKAEARASELQAAQAGFVADRDAVIRGARAAIDRINAVFDELETMRQQLIEGAARARKAVCARLNDVRTTSQVLQCSIAAAREALHALDDSATQPTIQRAGRVGQQLWGLVEASEAVRTQRGGAAPVFQHHEPWLKAWQRSLKVRLTDVEGYEEEWEVQQAVVSQPLPKLISPKRFHSAIATASNGLFVVGGETGSGHARAEHLAPGGDCWQDAQHLFAPLQHPVRFAVGVGNVVVAVGHTGTEVVAVDTVSGVHTALPPLPGVHGGGVVSLQGKVIVTGEFQGTDNVWALDVGNFLGAGQPPRQWTPLPRLVQAGESHGVAAGGGCVFVCGGYDDREGRTLDICAMLRVGAGQASWEALPPMPIKKSGDECCYGGGNLFVLGRADDDDDGPPPFPWLVLALNVRERVWRQVAALAVGRESCAVVCVGRRLLVLGGFSVPMAIDFAFDAADFTLASGEAFEFEVSGW